VVEDVVVKSSRSLSHLQMSFLLRLGFSFISLERVKIKSSNLLYNCIVQLNRLQAVVNVAARLILSGRRRDHITPSCSCRYTGCVSLSGLSTSCACLHGTAPEYLTSSFQCVSDVTTRRHLRSAATSQLIIPTITRCSTLGDRAFTVAALRAWNTLPHSVSSAPPLLTFRRLLKDTSIPS